MLSWCKIWFYWILVNYNQYLTINPLYTQLMFTNVQCFKRRTTVKKKGRGYLIIEWKFRTIELINPWMIQIQNIEYQILIKNRNLMKHSHFWNLFMYFFFTNPQIQLSLDFTIHYTIVNSYVELYTVLSLKIMKICLLTKSF